MSIPKTLRQVRRFIGATQYYRRHVMNFSRLAEPLINLTKVQPDKKRIVKIQWTPACQQAFDAIRKALMNAPILTNPVLDRDYRLYCDASITTIGSILTQAGKDGHERVILYISHKLSPAMLKHSIIVKECYAIFYSVKKLHFLLAGAHIDVFTDCKALLSLFKAKYTNSIVDRYGIGLSVYDTRLIHIKGVKNLFTTTQKYKERHLTIRLIPSAKFTTTRKLFTTTRKFSQRPRKRYKEPEIFSQRPRNPKTGI